MTLETTNAETTMSLDASEYRTLIEELLDDAGLVLQKLLRRPAAPPRWYAATIFYLCVAVVVGLAALLFDDPRQRLTLIQSIPSGTVLFFSAVLLAPVYFGYLAAGLCQYVPAGTNAPETVDSLRGWLDQFFDRRAALLSCLSFGVIVSGLYIAARSTIVGEFIGVGAALASLIIFPIASSSVPYVIRFLLHPPPLDQYPFQLFEPNPANTLIVRQLANFFDTFAYLYAVQAVVLSIGVLLAEGAPSYAVLILLLAWIPTLALFVVNYRTLARIIKRAKWKTMVELQGKIKAERVSIDTKERVEYLQRLIDHHDYVRRSPDSALNFNAVISLLRSLLLPTLVFLLVNLERIAFLLSGIFQ